MTATLNCSALPWLTSQLAYFAFLARGFACTLGARKKIERARRLPAQAHVRRDDAAMGDADGLAPDRLNRLDVAFALVGVAIGVTRIAARVTRR